MNEGSPNLGKDDPDVKRSGRYTGIGVCRLRAITDDENCPLVLWVGNKRLIKRKALEKYIDQTYSV